MKIIKLKHFLFILIKRARNNILMLVLNRLNSMIDTIKFAIQINYLLRIKSA